ncbi:MAG TPA: hypothetical protein VGE12_15335 [Noviherbaspirillum sp.]
MIIQFLVLLLAAISWVAAIWLLIQPDFAGWPQPGVIAFHAAPPLAAWLLGLWLHRRARAGKEAEAKARDDQAQAERQAALQEAHMKHAEELRQRRFACDCRAIAISALAIHADAPLVDVELPNVEIEQHLADEDGERAESPILDALTPSIADALSRIYLACRASAVFPIYVAPPSDVSGEDVLARIRAIHSELVETLDTGILPGTCSPAILFLPSRDCAANSVLSLFESTSDLPGAIVLAFDSPLSRTVREEELDDAPTPEQVMRQQQAGKPGQGVIAMLLTNAALPSMLAAIADAGNGKQDSMTPFWEKALQPGGNLALLVSANAESRRELAQLPILGRIHRASFREMNQARTGVLELTRLVQGALERAQVNAGIIDLPFGVEQNAAQPAKKNEEGSAPQTRCSWIIHNAGGVEVAGKRLAALGSSLYYFGIDLSPVDAASAMNIVTRIGDLGRATPVGQLALGVVHAARRTGPVLCAEYAGDNGVAVSFIMQAESA